MVPNSALKCLTLMGQWSQLPNLSLIESYLIVSLLDIFFYHLVLAIFILSSTFLFFKFCFLFYTYY